MYIRVEVFPKSKKGILVQQKEDSFLCYVKESAEGNRANRAVLGFLREHFKTNRIRLVSGHHSRKKFLLWKLEVLSGLIYWNICVP